MSVVQPRQQWDTDRILTVPNCLSFLRLLAIPVFGWLILAGHDIAAVVLLMISAATDWFDGYLARVLHQTSELGARLDPVADRLYILTALVTLTIRGIVPWWLFGVLVGRELLLVCLVPSLRRSGVLALPVSFTGKAGTMLVLMALPLLLIGASASMGWVVATYLGWFFAVLGAVAYWMAGIGYVQRTIELARQRRQP